jgi:hypothetical protein
LVKFSKASWYLSTLIAAFSQVSSSKADQSKLANVKALNPSSSSVYLSINFLKDSSPPCQSDPYASTTSLIV